MSTEEASLTDLGGWPAILALVTQRQPVPAALVRAAFTEVLEGRATAAQIAALAVGMRTKGETREELEAVLTTMQTFSVYVPLAPAVMARAIDTCGTGGDRSHSINVSTMAAFVVAAGGVPVCKHGGRAASSASGSADVLEALGVALDLSPEGVARCIDETGMGFCLAPRFHPAMRHAAPVRRELGVATMFNFLGPLANPGRVRHQVVGVADAAMAPKLAEVLAARGTRAWVLRGDDGLDELSTSGPSSVWDVDNGEISQIVVDPASLGFARASLAEIRGGTPAENANVVRQVLAGSSGAHRDIVVLNAAAAYVVAGSAPDLAAGVVLAARAIDSGAAELVLTRLIEVSRHEAKQLNNG